MATVRWVGTAPLVAQIQSYTFGGTWESDDIIRTTFGSKTYDFVAGSTTIATVIDNLVAAWNLLSSTSYPEWAELTASRSGSALLLTSDTPGRAFKCQLTPLETGGGSADAQTIEGAGTATFGTTSTANSGPNDWGVAANWSGGALPVDADDIYFENSSVDVLYNLDQSAIEPTSLSIDLSYTGKIGLPKRNPGIAGTSYNEYRDDYLIIGPVTLNIGKGSGAGSGRLKISTGSDTLTSCNVYGTGSPAEAGLEAFLLKGTTMTAVNIFKGSVGIAGFAGESAGITTLRVGYLSNQSSDAQVRCGAVTLTTLTQNGGMVELNQAVTTVTKTAGTLRIRGSATVTTLNELGGTTYYDSTGTITTLVVGNGGTFDCGQDMRSRTITNTTLHAGSTLRDPAKTITFTNAFSVSQVGLAPIDTGGVTLDLGTNFSLQRS